MKFRVLLAWLVVFLATMPFALAQVPITAPLASATTGTWVVNQDLTSFANGPGGKPLRYNYLLPSGYDPTRFIYPLMFVGAGNGQGMNGSTYPRDGNSFIGGMESDNFKFNTVAFRIAHPAIIVAPQCDQTLDGSGSTFNSNCGGYADGQNTSWQEQATNALVQLFSSNFAVDPTRRYGVGLSLSAIGYLAGLVDNNQINGPSGLNLWTAAVGMSDQLFRPGTANSAVFARMANVPFLSICAPGDNPCNYDLPLWQSITGNTNYPVQSNYDSGGVAAIRAGSSQFYLINTNGGTAYGTFGCLNADGCDGTALYAWLFSQSHGTTAPGTFKVSGGKILGPSGAVYYPKGINVYSDSLPSASAITTTFPGLNFIRFITRSMNTPTSYDAFVNALPGVVVEFEHHPNGGGDVDSSPPDSTIAQESAWYASMATHFKANPYVWFGTYNEPAPTSTLSAWQQSTYNAIRGTGSSAILLIEVAGSRPSNLQQVLTQSTYTPMTNVTWDAHIYNYQTNQATDAPTIDANIKAMVAAAQTITSADGVMPVIIGESGPSTDGTNLDPGGETSVLELGKAYTAHIIAGYIPFTWWPGFGSPNDLTDGSNNPTNPYGLDTQKFMALNVPVGETLSVSTIATVAQNTAFTVSGSISGVTSAPSLQYADNGGAWAALPAGASVSANTFSFLHAGMASNPAATVAVRDANNTAISATGPPFTVLGSASPNGTTISPGVGSFTDGAHVYTITSGDVATEDGTGITGGSGTGAGEWFNGLVYFQDINSGAWFTWNQTQFSAATAPGLTPTETLTVNAVGQQTAGTPFTVSGLISGVSAAPTLQYQDNGGTWQALPGSSTAVRDPYNQPGGNGSVYNTPFGSGATWSAATDADTLAICNGTCNGIINTASNFGDPVWTSSAASDPTFTFSSTNNGRTVAPDNGSGISASMHVPAGAYVSGPYPGDNEFVIQDRTSFPNRQYTWGGSTPLIQPPGLQAGQGPFTFGQGEWDDITSDQFGHDYDTGLSGYNIGAGLIRGCDVDPVCNPFFPKIKHGFRFMAPPSAFKSTGKNPAPDNTLGPAGWPDRLEDFQSGAAVYTGNLGFGATMGIPGTTAMPAGLDSNCQGLFWSLQHYPIIPRDIALGGPHLSDDQVADTSAWMASARGCISQLFGLVRVLRNQHQGGQSFTAQPINGPGSRTDTGPLPLTSSGGGTVTTTAFSFTHPGMVALGANVIAIRDANAPTITAASASFTVASTGSETIAIDAVGSQVAGSAFSMSGELSGLTSPPSLQYQDGSTGWTALPPGAIVTKTAFSFPHPGLTATSSAAVSVRDAANQTILATSNVFIVNASTTETLSINPIAAQAASVPFTVSGSANNTGLTLGLQYQDNNGAWAAFPPGSTVTVTPGSGTAGTPSFIDTFTTLDITDSGGAPTGGPATIMATTPGASLTDAGGNAWTIVSGQGVENGVVPVFSANVTEIALVNGVIWSLNTSAQWYFFTQTSPNVGTWTAGLNPLSGGIGGAWMNHYPFGGSEYTLSANGELEYFASTSRVGYSPFTLQNNGAGPGLVMTVDTTPQASFFAGHTPANPFSLPYNSAEISSATEPNGEPGNGLYGFQYGYIEIQALLPGGPGMWVGFVLYPFTGSGELDIIETGGTDLRDVFSSLHSSVPGVSTKVPVTDYTQNRHIYGVDWQPNFITWYVDRIATAQAPTPPDFIGKPYYIALDLAIQGNPNLGFDGVPTAATVFPGHMLLDWVKVWPNFAASQAIAATPNTAVWNFTQPGMAAAGSNTVAVRDAANTAVTASSNAFAVNLPTSANNTVVTTVGPQIVDATGEAFAINSAGQVTVNGVPDTTTSGAVALAYVSGEVWYENASKLWAGKTISTASWVPQPGTLTSPLPPESLTVGTIASQTVGVSFAVSGSISAALTAPSLQYSVTGGPWTAFPAGAQVSTTAYNLTIPAISAAGNATVAVRDAGTVSISVTSNSFSVVAAPVEVLSIATIPNQTQNTAFRITGSIANAATIPTLQYAVNGGTWLALPSGSPASLVTQTSFAFTVPGISATGNTTISVRDANATTVTASSNTFQNGAVVGESLTLQAIAAQLAAAPFSVSGTISNATGIPTLQYAVSGGAWNALPAGFSVTASAYTFTVPGLATASAATISVRDANATTVSVTSNSFLVSPVGSESLTMAPMAYQLVGIPFSVSGSILNAASAPSLQYADNGGNFQALPAGSSVTATSYSFIHPGLSAAQSMTVMVRDAARPAITAAAPAFEVLAHESQNLTVITTVGPQIVDQNGVAYTITPGQQVARNGIADATTSHVIEIAYVNRQVWYENTNLQWWALSNTSTWGPTGGTLLGPLPSSHANIYLTSTAKLAVVTGFSTAVPGIIINDTIVGGTFSLVINAIDGVVSMPGASGVGTAHMTESGTLASLNAALSGLQFLGKTIGNGMVSITVTDPAASMATANVNIAVARPAAVIPPGRKSVVKPSHPKAEQKCVAN